MASSDFADRLEAVEAKLASLQVSDLPLKQLQDKLEQDWQPNAPTLLGAGSITPAMMGRDEGFYSTTWPGGVAVTSLLIPHALGAVPTKVLATGQADLYFIRWLTGTTTNKLLGLSVRTFDGSTPALGTVLALSWAAIK